jgi:hypothetical protein
MKTRVDSACNNHPRERTEPKMPDETKEQHVDAPPLPNVTVTQQGPYGAKFSSPYFYFGPKAGSPGEHVKVTLDLSPELAQSLDSLLNETRDTPSDLFRKALGLYKLAKEAKREGKAVGAAKNPDSLETEFVGL